MGVQEHKHHPLVNHIEQSYIAQHFITIGKVFMHVDASCSNMTAIVEVVGVMIWYCEGRHSWIKPEKTFWSSHQEMILYLLPYEHEEGKGHCSPQRSIP